MNVIGLDMSASMMYKARNQDQLWNKAHDLLDRFGEDTVVIGYSSEPEMLKGANESRAALSQNWHNVDPGGTDTAAAIRMAAAVAPGCTLHLVTDGMFEDVSRTAREHGVRVQEHRIVVD